MGLLDNIKDGFNRGTASAGRTIEKVQLNSKLDDIAKERKDFMAQLGASVYQLIKEMPELREGRESLFAAIDDCDARSADIKAQIEALEAEAEAAEALQNLTCAKCGNPLKPDALFCAACGTKVEKEEPTTAAKPTGKVCPSCGASNPEDGSFCINCGSKLN